MAANAAGETNAYDLRSFKLLLKQSKQAFKEGFDLGILPEGQLNPDPQLGLLDTIYPGAYTLARSSKRPIRFLALHGVSNLWHADPNIGQKVLDHRVRMRVYDAPQQSQCQYRSADQFVQAFRAVVGTFATTGADLKDDAVLQQYLDGAVGASEDQQ